MFLDFAIFPEAALFPGLREQPHLYLIIPNFFVFRLFRDNDSASEYKQSIAGLKYYMPYIKAKYKYIIFL